MSCLPVEREPYWQNSEASSSSILVDAGSARAEPARTRPLPPQPTRASHVPSRVAPASAVTIS